MGAPKILVWKTDLAVPPKLVREALFIFKANPRGESSEDKITNQWAPRVPVPSSSVPTRGLLS